MLKVVPISAFQDNYIWLICFENTQSAVVVDPGDATPVLDYLKAHDLNLTAVLITHHHADHIGGISKILENFSVPVYGPENIVQVTHNVKENSEISLFDNLVKLKVIAVPGHTLDHIVYYGDNKLFCGDTVFSAGCGRMFEGNPAEYLVSLKKIIDLPEQVLIYPAHEYTEKNVEFALTVEPDNQDMLSYMDTVKKMRYEISPARPTLPTTVGLEKKINPFFRAKNTEEFARLRTKRDSF